MGEVVGVEEPGEPEDQVDDYQSTDLRCDLPRLRIEYRMVQASRGKDDPE